MARLTPEQVKFLSFDDGGAAGFTVHPGVNQALEEKEILQYNNYGRQVGVLSFAGSSSGSVFATLTSLGYHHDEISQLLSPAAFDMIFRLEHIILGERLKLFGVSQTEDLSNELVAINLANFLSNSIGTLHNALMILQSDLKNFVDVALTYKAFSDSLDKRRSAIELIKLYYENMKFLGEELINEFSDRKKLTELAQVLTIQEFYEKNYPEIISKLVNHLTSDVYNMNSGTSNGNNILNIIKLDYGMFSGLYWREFFDNTIAFAAFRVKHPEVIEFLELPSLQEYENAYDIRELFLNRINDAWNKAHPDESVDVYDDYLNITFYKHKEIFYPHSNISPLHLTGSNLSSKESHVFSCSKTKNMSVADAIRISTSVAPVFKPIILDQKDISSIISSAYDRYGNKNFMEGVWFDGGLYLNSPILALKEYETESEKILGIGINTEDRVEITNVTEYAKAILFFTLETNISYTEFDLDHFINYVGFDIALEKPKMSANELKFYKMYSYYETLNYFDSNSPGESYVGQT